LIEAGAAWSVVRVQCHRFRSGEGRTKNAKGKFQ
jgi:hypothetical protein